MDRAVDALVRDSGLSGVFFPLPESIRWVALSSPAFHLNQHALHTAGTPSILGTAINIAASSASRSCSRG